MIVLLCVCRMANRASAHLCTDRLPEDIITERPDLQTTGGTHNDCQRHADHTQVHSSSLSTYTEQFLWFIINQ